MEKLKFAFKTLSNEEINAKNYDLTICENLFGDSTFILKDGDETKYVKLKSVRSVLTGKNEIVLTDMTDNHIVGIVEDAFNENNVHNRTFTSEIESDVVKPEPQPEPVEPDPNDEPDEPIDNPEPNPEEPKPDVPDPEPDEPDNPDEPGDDPEPVSDEFTYTKEPGKIKKVFLHLYDGNTLETFSADSESVDGNHNCYIDADGVIRRELYDTENLAKIGDNTVDLVVAVDTDITRDSNINDNIISPIINDTNAHDRLFAQITQDMENRNVHYEFWTDPNDSSSSRVVINSAEDVYTLLYALAHSYRSNRVYLRDNNFEPSEFHVMGSDKVFNGDEYNVDHIDTIGWTDFDMHSVTIGALIDEASPDSSTGFQGIYIIQKALETGRALDIGVDLSKAGWDYPMIKRNDNE